MIGVKPRSVIVVATLLGLAVAAWADDVASYQTSGGAPAAIGDPRTTALDEAFARAVRSALADVLPSDQRTAHQAELDREIIGRARRWVTTFTVTKDDVVDGRRELMVAVQIDRDKIRARLEQLNVAAAPRAEPIAAPAIAVDVQVTAAPRTRTAAVARAGVSALTAALQSAGMAVRPLATRNTATRDAADADKAPVPGEAATPRLIAIAELNIGEPTRVRGQADDAVLVAARVRLVENRGSAAREELPTAGRDSARAGEVVIAQGQGSAAARVDEPRSGVERAIALAATSVLPRLPGKAPSSAPRPAESTPVAEPGVVFVRLPPGTSYAMVLAEQKFLAGAKAIRAATVRRLSSSGWLIGVTTTPGTDSTPQAAIDRVARLATQPPANDVQVAVKVVRGVVEVTITGAP